MCSEDTSAVDLILERDSGKLLLLNLRIDPEIGWIESVGEPVEIDWSRVKECVEESLQGFASRRKETPAALDRGGWPETRQKEFFKKHKFVKILAERKERSWTLCPTVKHPGHYSSYTSPKEVCVTISEHCTNDEFRAQLGNAFRMAT